MPSQVLVLRIFKELSFAPVEDTLEGLCMLNRALVSYRGEENRFDFVGRRLKVRRKVCVGWGIDSKGLGLSFNAPHLLCVILGRQSYLFEHQFPPRFEDVELMDVSCGEMRNDHPFKAGVITRRVD